LEERLDRRLFERGPRGVTLTVDGNCLLEAVGEHVDGIEHALGAYRTRHHDALTLSASPGIMSSWLVPRLPKLVAAYPELDLSLQSGSTLVNFAREPVDVALRYGRGQWPELLCERLFGEWIAPVAAPALVALAAARRARRIDPLERLVRPHRRRAAETLRGAVRQPRRAAPCGAGGSRRGAGADGDVEVADRRRPPAGAGQQLPGGEGSLLAGVSAALAGAPRPAALPRLAAGGGGRIPGADVELPARRPGGRLTQLRKVAENRPSSRLVADPLRGVEP